MARGYLDLYADRLARCPYAPDLAAPDLASPFASGDNPGVFAQIA
jgi:hypothetical protein